MIKNTRNQSNRSKKSGSANVNNIQKFRNKPHYNLIVISLIVVGLAIVGYFIISSRASSDTGSLKLFTPAWRGIAGQQPSTVSTKFEYIFGNWDSKLNNQYYVDLFHIGNPESKIIKYQLGPYVSTVNKAELISNYPNALARDAAGNYIKTNGFDNWLTNPASSDWLNYIAMEVSRLMDKANGNMDGIILDSMGVGPIDSNYVTSKPINPQTGKAYTKDEWIKAERKMIDQVVSVMKPGKTVYLNGLSTGIRYWSSQGGTKNLLVAGYGGANYTVNGGMSETTFRSAESSALVYPNYTSWESDIRMIEDVQNMGKKGFWWTKCWPSINSKVCPTSELTKQRRYALGSYLLSFGSNSYFNFDGNFDNNAAEDHADYDNVKTSLGSTSVGREMIRDFGGKTGKVWKRTFSTGLVIVNPTKNSTTFTLTKSYKSIDGAVKTGAIMISPNSAEILFDIRN